VKPINHDALRGWQNLQPIARWARRIEGALTGQLCVCMAAAVPEASSAAVPPAMASKTEFILVFLKKSRYFKKSEQI